MRGVAANEFIRPYAVRWLQFGLLRQDRPAYLTDCWRYPNWKLFPSPDSAAVKLPEIIREPDVLFLPMTDWHTRTQRTQHLAMALAAAGHRCFYVNPHLGFEFPRTYAQDRCHRLSRLAPRILELHLRLPREPIIHRRLPVPRESRILQQALEQLCGLAKTRKLVQIVSHPFWLDLALALRSAFGFPLIYDCHDHLSGFQGIKPEVANREPALFQSCDLAVFCSQPLMDSKIAEFQCLRDKSELARNAAMSGGHAPNDEPKPVRTGARPARVIGYVGALDHWFDVAALREAARRWPDWEFVLIGRIESASVEELRELHNVKFLGEIPHSELGAHLADFDVGLIPFLRNELTLSANPIKLYEYFGYGLPVVSSRLPEVEMFGDLVYIAESPGDFAGKLGAAASEQDPQARQRRIAVARKETWEARAIQFQKAFGRLLEPRNPAD